MTEDEKTRGQVLRDGACDIGGEVKLSGFVRFGLGEGIDKGPEEDFASEVAAAVGSS